VRARAENGKLWNWYLSARFTPAKTLAGFMYAPYENLMPELARAG